jgi:ABC-type multidrug transport system ATPase subunit
MGASGSGKSTLLNVLNGSDKPSSGRVLINSIDVHEHAEQLEGVLGFIPQDDLLMDDLTVFENLYYSARLCFGHYSKKEIADLVEKVLMNLGLSEIRNLKAGSPLQKTISGGQRKRLNIGLELLREPTILFVDEPTSGLSSRDSENIMDLLKELSLRGKMIFVVIHQPSSDIFKMFDSLIILDVGGFQIYYGNPIESVNYFQEIINAAYKTPGECPECGNINPEQVFNIIETRVVNEYGRFTRTRKISPGQWYQYFKQKIKIHAIEQAKDPLPSSQKIPNWFKQLAIFSIRDVLSKLANEQYLLINLLLSPVLALFMAYFVKYYDAIGVENPVYTFYNNYNVPVYFFMSVVVALFVGLIVSAEEIFKDRKILKRERYLHLSKSSYLVSKVFVLFTLSAIQTFTFILVGNLIIEIPLTEMRYWLILFSCSCFANVLGLNISSAFDSAVAIYILIPILIIPQLLLSGVVISFDKFNPNVGTPSGIPLLGEVMASRWAFEALMVTQFVDNPFEKQFYELDKEHALAEYKRVYYLPALESKLAYCLNHRNKWRDVNDKMMTSSLALLKTELENELKMVGREQFPDVEKLAVGKFDSAVYNKASTFIRSLKNYYNQQVTVAMANKDKTIVQLTNTPEKMTSFSALKMKSQNKAVSDMVENANDPIRIVEWKGELIQKIYPVYFDDHRPHNRFDFTGNFFIPTKHFLGRNYPTIYFNVAMIWFMIIMLYAALYYEVLKKLVHALETRRKYRVRDKNN